MSFRLFSREQISDGTSISSRLDRVLADFVRRWNGVPKRDVRRRFFPDYTVAGWTPAKTASTAVLQVPANDGLPFCRSYNIDADVIAAGVTDLDELVQNRERNKGYGVDGIYAGPVSGFNGNTYTWTTSATYGRPVLLTSFAVWLTTDSVFLNTFVTNGSSAQDFTVSIEIDDPFVPEDRSLSSQVYLKTGFPLAGFDFSNLDLEPVYNGFMSVGGGAHSFSEWEDKMPSGVMIVQQDLNIPVPRDSRLRFSLVIPDYEDAPNFPISSWRTGPADVPASQMPWERQSIGWNLGIAEGVI
jgi:hypothetical protein